MANAEAVRRAREAAVGQQRHLLADTLAVERRRRRQHLAHARSAARPLIADDDHVALFVSALFDRFEGVLLAVEAQRRTAEAQRVHAGDFDDRTLRSEVALEDGEAAGRRDRVRGRANDLLPAREFHIPQVLGDGLAGNGHAIAVQIAAVEQCLHQHRHAPDVVQILHHVAAARLQIADIGCAFGDLAEIMQ